MTPFFSNMYDTEFGSVMCPPCLVKRWRISELVRLRLSVSVVDEDRDPARRVSLERGRFVAHAVELAGAALDRALDVLVRHVALAGALHRRPETRVVLLIAAPLARGGQVFP